MKVQYSPYSLIKKNKVNALDHTSTQDGALIRILNTDENVWGVADLCPWPSLGDLTLQQELKQKGLLLRRALQLAEEDLKARQEKKSLLYDQWVDNNLLVSDYMHFDFKNPKYAGHTFKIKADQQLFRLIETLQAAPKDLVFRLDFNSVLTRDEFQLFLNHVSAFVQIEYIEDPCSYDEKLWKKWNELIPLAADFVSVKDLDLIRIFKPAREEQPNQDVVVTSAMDHPVGVAHALRIAQKVAKKKSGLLTLDLYEPTDFHSYFTYRNLSEINFTAKALNDFGIGMTEELQALSWKDLP